tara:strand:- start:5030 stop:5290 length:261 start_codon:yes stop_codon:yes gene_type:complete
MKNNHILIKEIVAENKSKGGIYVPRPKYNRKAIVLAVTNTPQIKKGDIILRNIGKSTKHKINNENCEIIHISDIIAVLKNIKDAKT